MAFERSEILLAAISDGYWDWNLKTGEIFYSKEWKTMLGYAETDFPENSSSVWESLIHPDDKPQVDQKIAEHLSGKTKAYNAEFRLRGKDGQYRWILDRGKVVEWTADGLPLRMVGTQTDINSQKHLEEELLLSQNRYLTIIEDQTELICRYRPNGELTFVNQAFSSFVGMNQNELLGKCIFSFIHPKDEELVRSQIATLSPRYQIIENEYRFKRSDGKIRWTKWRNHWLSDPKEEAGEIQSVGQDHTDYRNILDQLNNRRQFDRLVTTLIARFTSFQQENLDEIIQVSLKELGEALSVDRTYLFLFDFAKESMSCTHEWVAPEIPSKKESLQNLPLVNYRWWIMQLQEKKEIVLDSIEEISESAGAERTLLKQLDVKSVLVTPIEDKNKGLIGFMGFDTVHAQKVWDRDLVMILRVLAEAIANTIEARDAGELMRINEARERLFIEALPALILRIDNNDLILDYMSGCHGVLSQYVSLHEPEPKTPLADFFNEEIATALSKRTPDALHAQAGENYEFEIEVANQKATLEARYSTFESNEKILVIQDVSEKKKLQQQKTDFINNATHEMRTPLTTMMLMVDLIEKQNPPLKQMQYWEVLKGEVMREKMLIEQLLTVSRIEKGKFPISQKNLDILASIRTAVAVMQPLAEGKGIHIKLNLPDDPVYVVGDTNAFQIIFTNLLSNAIKFTEDILEIGVDVTVNAPDIKVIFWDHGMGIPAEDLPHIFERFSRGKNAIAEEIQGSGIGLFIVRHLMQTFGGKAEIESKIAAGTKVILSFPALEKI